MKCILTAKNILLIAVITGILPAPAKSVLANKDGIKKTRGCYHQQPVFTDTVNTSSLTIGFDLDNARQTILLLKKQKLSEAELDLWVNLPGTKALISKVHSSADTAISAIRKAAAQQPLTAHEKRFQYDFIYNNLREMEDFIGKLDANKDSIIAWLKNKLGQYLPAGKKATVTLYGLMGSYSAGFAFTNEPAAFYMGLHFYKKDIQGVTVSAQHELFHTLQTAAYDYNPVMEKMKLVDSAYEAPYYLLRHLYMEGSAEYVADGKPYIVTSPFLKNEFDHMVVNTYRHEAAFYLLDRMLVDAYRHPNAMNFDHLYSILFDWNWSNPAYYAGREMIRALIKEHGKQYLHQSLEKDALFFVKDYIKLAKTGKQPGLYVFSGDFEMLVENMIHEMK